MMKLKKSLLTLLMLTVSILALNLATGAYDRMSCIYSIITTANIDTSDADLSLLDEFTDFPDSDPSFSNYSEMVAKALELGIIQGYGDGTLRLTTEYTKTSPTGIKPKPFTVSKTAIFWDTAISLDLTIC